MLWRCPVCGNQIRAPSKLRRLDTRRFCLPCSADSSNNLLVERAAPARERKRSIAAQRQKIKRSAKKARELANRTQADLATRFACGVDALQAMRYKLARGFLAEVRQAKARRATKVTAEGVVLYDFEGCDKFSARAVAVVGQIRWLLRDTDWSPSKIKSWMREQIEGALKIRLPLHRLADAEIDLADKLRAEAAVKAAAAASDDDIPF